MLSLKNSIKDFLSPPDNKNRNLLFRKFVNVYKESLYSHIRYTLMDHEDTDYVLQKTFIEIIQKTDSLDRDIEVKTWLYRTATRNVMTYLDEKARDMDISVEEL